MKKSVFALTTACLIAAGVARGQDPATMPATQATSQGIAMSSIVGDASYGVGYNMGRQLAQAPFKLDIDRIIAGLRDSSSGKPSAIPEAALRQAMTQLQQEARAGAEPKSNAGGDANVSAGDAYRATNAKKPGVTTTPSGLQIETIIAGTGDSPKPTDNVKVHYVGTLIDGTKFDSSIDRGEPITFPLNGVIKGWTEGLQLMKTGGKARLVIPPSLAYGPDGAGPIPPNATLIFEVQLLEIEK